MEEKRAGYCTKCGTAYQVGQKFCQNCGNRVELQNIEQPQSVLRQPEVKPDVQQPKEKVSVRQPEVKAGVQQPEEKASVRKPEVKPDVQQPKEKVNVRKPEVKTSVQQSKKELSAGTGSQATKVPPQGNFPEFKDFESGVAAAWEAALYTNEWVLFNNAVINFEALLAIMYTTDASRLEEEAARSERFVVDNTGAIGILNEAAGSISIYAMPAKKGGGQIGNVQSSNVQNSNTEYKNAKNSAMVSGSGQAQNHSASVLPGGDGQGSGQAAGKETEKEPAKESGKEPEKETGKEPGKETGREQAETPIGVLVDEVKTKIKGFKKLLSIKGVAKKLLISAGSMFVMWLVALIGQKICADKVLKTPFVLKLIAFVTFSNGGVSGNAFYQLGGMFGKMLVSSTVFAVVLGGFKMLKSGVREFVGNIGKITNLNILPRFLYGMSAALILYNFYTGQAMISLSMVGVAGVLSMLWAIGGGVHFIRRMVVSLTADVNKQEKMRYVNLEKTCQVLSGMAAGFLLAIPLSLIPWGYVPYCVGLAAWAAGIGIHIFTRSGKRAAAAMLVLIILVSSLLPVLLPAVDTVTVYAGEEKDREKVYEPDEDILPKKFAKSDRRNWFCPTDDANGYYFDIEIYSGSERLTLVGDIDRKNMTDLGKEKYEEQWHPYGNSPTKVWPGIYPEISADEVYLYFDVNCIDNAFFVKDSLVGSYFDGSIFEGEATKIAGYKAYTKSTFEIGDNNESCEGSKRLYVLLDDEVIPGMQLILSINITAKSGMTSELKTLIAFSEVTESEYASMVTRIKGRLEEMMNTVVDDMIKEAVELPFGYSIRNYYVDNGITFFDPETGKVKQVPADIEHSSGMMVATAILCGLLGELIAVFGALGYDFGGYFGGNYSVPGGNKLKDPTDKWLKFDEEGDIEYTDPVTGERSNWVKQDDGKYRKAGDGSLKTEEELREQAAYADRNQEELKKTAEKHEENVKHNRENQEEYNKRKLEENRKLAEDQRKHREYVEKLQEKYGEYDPDKLRNEIKKAQIKAGMEGAEADTAAAYAELGYETAKIIKETCDKSVDSIACIVDKVPGVGDKAKLIKDIYNMSTEFIGEVGDAYASGGSIGTGILNGVTKSLIVYSQNRADGTLGKAFTQIAGEAVKGAIDSAKEGKDIKKGYLAGMTKGLFNTFADNFTPGGDGDSEGYVNALTGLFSNDRNSDIGNIIDGIFDEYYK